MDLLVLHQRSRGGLYNIRTKTNHSTQQLCFRSVVVTTMRDNEKARHVSCTMKCPSFCACHVVDGKQMLWSLNRLNSFYYTQEMRNADTTSE